MKIKRFEALEMSDALRAVRDELGPDAIILSTREVKKAKGSFGMLSRSVSEVTAAVDLKGPEEQPTRRQVRSFDNVLDEVENTMSVDLEMPIKEELQGIRETLQTLQADKRESSDGMPAYVDETLIEVREMIRSIAKDHFQMEINKANQPVSTIFSRLMSNGLDQRTVMGLYRILKERLSADELWKEDFIQHYVEELIGGMTKVSGPLNRNASSPKVVALVGPTGVGKTTTIAKLAAHHYQGKKNVMLATLDTYRVGAVEQLKIYAKIIGVPVTVAVSGRQLRDEIKRRKEGDLILIDTPGRSHLNTPQMRELKELQRVGFPVETHLLLSSNTKTSDLDEMIDRFSVIPIHSLIFTKVDETRTFGHLFSAMRFRGKPLSYITTGQRVPEDIEVVTPKRVAELVMS